MRAPDSGRERGEALERRLHWPDWASLARGRGAGEADDEAPLDLDALRQMAKISYKRLSECRDAAEIAAAIHRFEGAWRRYVGPRDRALMRAWLEPSDASALNCLQRFAEEEAEQEALLNTVYRPLLEREDIVDLAAFLGKSFVLRVQNRQALYKVDLTEALQTEKVLLANGPEQSGVDALHQRVLRRATGQARGDGRESQSSPEEGFEQLFDLRERLAEALQLPNFMELSFLRQERYDARLDAVLNCVEAIRRYLFPLALELRRALGAEEDLAPAACFDAGEAWLPEGLRLPELEAAGDDWDFLDTFIGKVVLDRAPQVLRPLIERGCFLRAPGQSLALPMDCRLLAAEGFPCLFVQSRLSAAALPGQLAAVGLAYAYLCSYQDGGFALMRRPSSELRRVWAQCLPFLALESLPQLFSERAEGERYRRLLLVQAVLRLCHQCMLFEFAYELNRMGRGLREGRERLWARALRKYYPELAEDSAWLRMQRGGYLYRASLWADPFASVGELQALLCALQLWDASRGDRQLARNRYETLCSLGTVDALPELLKQARFEDPWGEGNVKRLAYQLAYELGY